MKTSNDKPPFSSVLRVSYINLTLIVSIVVAVDDASKGDLQLVAPGL